MALPKTDLLESVGWSYSGVSDLFEESPDKKEPFLRQLDNQYNYLKEQQDRLEKELSKIMNARAYCVNMFCIVHSVLHTDSDNLTFRNGSRFVVVKRLSYEESRIDYNSYEITKLK